MAKRNSRRARKRNDPTAKIARKITTEAQVANGKFVLCDVSNHNDQDQRHMVRSGERQTIRRQPKFEELRIRKVISEPEAAACRWYLDTHAARYDTVGVTARYGTYSSSGCSNFDHLPKTKQQQDAWLHFSQARAAINPFFLPMFERIVLHGRPLGRLTISFRTAVRELLAQIEGKVELEP